MPFNRKTYDHSRSLIAGSSSLNQSEESLQGTARFQQLQNIPLHFIPLMYEADYATQKYFYIDNTCNSNTGKHSGTDYDEGIQGYKKRVFDPDNNIINQNIFPVNFNFLKTIPLSKYQDFVFSHNYRLQNSRGECMVMLQRYTYVAGHDPGIPAGIVGIAFNITHFKNDLGIIHTIEEYVQQNNQVTTNLIYKKIHPVYDIPLQQSISDRELMILQLMTEGLSNKQIAARLQLSQNTINNHRKNMLHKTNCKSSSELLSHAIQHGLLYFNR